MAYDFSPAIFMFPLFEIRCRWFSVDYHFIQQFLSIQSQVGWRTICKFPGSLYALYTRIVAGAVRHNLHLDICQLCKQFSINNSVTFRFKLKQANVIFIIHYTHSKLLFDVRAFNNERCGSSKLCPNKYYFMRCVRIRIFAINQQTVLLQFLCFIGYESKKKSN